MEESSLSKQVIGGSKAVNSTMEPRRYEVLYYKRTNKVHKSKGVSKLDGILTITSAPTCKVTLVDANGETSDETDTENEEEPRRRKKGKWKKPAQKSKSSSSAWSGIHRELSKRAFGDGFQPDDVITLPQYECQIISVLSAGGGSAVSKSLAQKQHLPKMTQPKRQALPLQSRTKLLKSKAPLGKSPLNRRMTAYPSQKAAKPSSSSTPTWQARRIPPRQPSTRGHLEDKTEESPDCETENCPPPPTIKRPLLRDPTANKIPSSLTSKKRRRLAPAPPKSASSSNITSPPPHQPPSNNSANDFPGAIGNVIVPPSVRAVLRPHQRQGVAFLWNCLTGASPSLREACKNAGISTQQKGCILADEMGLGKTLMTISTIFALFRKRKDHRFIIVCPSSLVSNWSKEFDKWIGKASQPKRVVIRKGGEEGMAALRAFVPIKPHQSEVLIVSYDLFRMNSSILTQAKQIGLLCVDEGHRLKNTAGSLTLTALNALNCEARLLITGTPIQNNLSEFHNVANFVCPGLLGDLKSFKRIYERPISAANNKKATWEQKTKGQSQSRALENITKTFMLRRLQKDILKSLLPPRQELLLFCRPSQHQCDVYKSLTSNYNLDANVAGASAEALTVLTNLRKLCSHPSLLQDVSMNSPNMKNQDIAMSGKLLVLESLLKAIRDCNPDDKVVIVSNFTSALDVIESLVLWKNSWSFQRLDGSTNQADRQTLVDSFNRSTPEHSFAFLLSSKAGGCGLNLIGANRLIMFDNDWNPATDMQAMARIYRQGQAKPCFIYRFFTSGTVEEVIYQRQVQKGNLSTLTVDGGNSGNSTQSSNKGFTKEELRDCFTLKEGCACDTKGKVGNQWPNYNGAPGLQAENCFDEPLLAVAGEESQTLTFVHVVQEETEEEQATTMKEDTKKQTSSLDYDREDLSSDEEFEFE